MLTRGELQKHAKKSKFENFESALYSTSVSMPLMTSHEIRKLHYRDLKLQPIQYPASYSVPHSFVRTMLGPCTMLTKLYFALHLGEQPKNKILFIHLQSLIWPGIHFPSFSVLVHRFSCFCNVMFKCHLPTEYLYILLQYHHIC